ncbi:hypothetical protein Sango_0670800 [Sesamum angolense]|uniref:RING-type domain-containing protein n=1 Tax=Sesamum angolense TaxID=2727404 RepID=A0AAE1X7C8_9LAMI|nr:hypothetical protein Sango_0670800 [Sesamum angolense]
MWKLLSDNGNQEFGDFKLTILGMLGTYDFERRILDAAKSLIEDDTYYTMSLLRKGASHGYAPRSLVCCICNSFVTKNSADSSIQVFSCGHTMHLHCELQENGASFRGTVSGCPVCIPRKKAQRSSSKSTLAENGLVSRSSSRTQQARGSPALYPHDHESADNSYSLHPPSRFELLHNLEKDQKSIQIENVPQLRLAPPALYHEKVKKGIAFLAGESTSTVSTTEKTRSRRLGDVKVKGSFPLKSNIFGKVVKPRWLRKNIYKRQVELLAMAPIAGVTSALESLSILSIPRIDTIEKKLDQDPDANALDISHSGRVVSTSGDAQEPKIENEEKLCESDHVLLDPMFLLLKALAISSTEIKREAFGTRGPIEKGKSKRLGNSPHHDRFGACKGVDVGEAPTAITDKEEGVATGDETPTSPIYTGVDAFSHLTADKGDQANRRFECSYWQYDYGEIEEWIQSQLSSQDALIKSLRIDKVNVQWSLSEVEDSRESLQQTLLTLKADLEAFRAKESCAFEATIVKRSMDEGFMSFYKCLESTKVSQSFAR